MALVERLQPPLVIDLHSPLELLLQRGDVPPAVVESLSGAADLPVRRRRRGAVPGRIRRLALRGRDSGDRLRGRARRATRPLCAPPAGPRGAPPFRERRQAFLTGPGRRRRRGRRYSTRVTAARLCVVSSPPYGALERARRRRHVAVVAPDGDRDVAQARRASRASGRRPRRAAHSASCGCGTSTSTQACVPPSPSRWPET